MIAFIPFAVAFASSIQSTTASPIVIENAVTVFVTADTSLPTGVVIPSIGGSSPSSAATVPLISALSGAGAVFISVAVIAGGIDSPAVSFAGSGATAASSVVSTSLDASLVSAVARIQGITTPLTAANMLVKNINLILKGADNNTPVSLITDFTGNTSDFAAATDALAKLTARGVAEESSAYPKSSISSITTYVNTLSTLIQQFKPAGTQFNAQFLPGLNNSLEKIQLLGTSCQGKYNANALASAAATLSSAISTIISK
ncbi:hypothetical protein B0H13DRAFT_2420281 [Mycena leptocephala]|nr:hypothetical protein B0H13DRAFT_2420281 [Mycena leptocephala]